MGRTEGRSVASETQRILTSSFDLPGKLATMLHRLASSHLFFYYPQIHRDGIPPPDSTRGQK